MGDFGDEIGVDKAASPYVEAKGESTMGPFKLPTRLLVATIFIFQIHSAIAAQGDWEKSAKDAYVNRCSKSMIKNGLPIDKAARYCRCAVDGLR